MLDDDNLEETDSPNTERQEDVGTPGEILNKKRKISRTFIVEAMQALVEIRAKPKDVLGYMFRVSFVTLQIEEL